MGVSEPSLLIESTDSMISKIVCSPVEPSGQFFKVICRKQIGETGVDEARVNMQFVIHYDCYSSHE